MFFIKFTKKLPQIQTMIKYQHYISNMFQDTTYRMSSLLKTTQCSEKNLVFSKSCFSIEA